MARFLTSFHDAEVLSISLNREGTSRISLHTFETTGEVNDRASSFSAVTFVLDHIQEMSLDGFNKVNWLGSISIEPLEDEFSLSLHGL